MPEALEAWLETLNILIQRLADKEEDLAQEAVSVLLLQGLELFGGPDSVLMQQCFPVLDAIKRALDRQDLHAAVGQAFTLQTQLLEVLELVRIDART